MRKWLLAGVLLAAALSTALGIRHYFRYQTEEIMTVPIEEVTAAEYPEDPSHRSLHYSQYGRRTLKLVKKDGPHFDFIFESDDPHVANIILKDVDLSLYVPAIPKWVKGDSALEVLAVVEREWNRQQVSFSRQSEHLEVVGGDGFETKNLSSVELARNGLNAGLWELQLYTVEDGQKALYYQGWFTLPLGHFKKVFETINDTSYWQYWHRLEYWLDPEGKQVNLARLRQVVGETEVKVARNPKERIIAAGEQLRKVRTIHAKEVRHWEDLCEEKSIRFASYIAPGRYSVDRMWDHEYERIAALDKSYVRRVTCPVSKKELYEIELVFRNVKTGVLNRFIVGGVDIKRVPQLPVSLYPEGLYMPMGISVPPFYQSYEHLKAKPPQLSPYYSLLLDEKGRWVNHHEVAIDGPVMHRDVYDPNLLHLYLLSYERHALVGHFIVSLDET